MPEPRIPPPLLLLLPEWQGYGLSAQPADGARQLAELLFAGQTCVTIDEVDEVNEIDAPGDEPLRVNDGVLGLTSITTRLERTMTAVRQAAPQRIVTVGATCGVEIAPIAWLNERYAGDLAVLWLDAHGDLNTPASSPSGHFHGMVLRTLLGQGPAALVRQIPLPLTTRQVWLVGARDLDPPEVQFVAASGIGQAGDEAFAEPQTLCDRLKMAGFTRIYVHFDVDVVNPDDFASSLMATAGGPTLELVVRLLHHLHEQCEVVGFSVVEYCERRREDRQRLCESLIRFVPRSVRSRKS